MSSDRVQTDELLVLRVWLPDRPGALGAVATRIGAVGGDLVGIEIVDRGAGRVVDELSVSLPNSDLVDLMVSEIQAVEGTDVEDMRWVGGHTRDPVVSALELAARLATVTDRSALATDLVQGAAKLLYADWAVLVDTATESAVAHRGTAGTEVPSAGWLCSFLRGVGETSAREVEPAEGSAQAEVPLDDVAFGSVGDSTLVLVVSRARVPLRGRERSVLHELCALAAAHGLN